MENKKSKIVALAGKITDRVRTELEEAAAGGKKRKFARFALAALSSIPWVGGFLSATAALDAEKEQGKANELHQLWYEEHKKKLIELGTTIADILNRLSNFDEEIKDRIESPSYLSLIRKGFRSWDQADTQEKRNLIKNLLTNAGGTKLCPDDLVRLFIEWIDHYHEAHFMVIREIYKKPGITRGGIWNGMHGDRPREDSAEADLYKRLIRDLSTGGVIRQHRPTNIHGQFIKKSTKGRQGSSSSTMKSAFDDQEPYELTELGRQFVHYTMDELAPQIES